MGAGIEVMDGGSSLLHITEEKWFCAAQGGRELTDQENAQGASQGTMQRNGKTGMVGSGGSRRALLF